MANKPKPSGAGDNLKRLMDLYRTMVRIRAFEETALSAHKAGEIPGPLHDSLGQEGVAAGVCASLRRDDRLTSNRRGHGHAIAKGAVPIPGAKNAAQAQENAGALGWLMGDDDVAALDAAALSGVRNLGSRFWQHG